MDKKGVAQIAIPATIVALAVFIIRLIALNYIGDVILDEVEPQLEKLLDELDKNIICPPEFANENYDVCFNGKGEVIVNGKLGENLELKSAGNSLCLINQGEYIHQGVCQIGSLDKMTSLSLSGSITTSLDKSRLIFYLKNVAYLKKPIRGLLGLGKIVRYIPIK